MRSLLMMSKPTKSTHFEAHREKATQKAAWRAALLTAKPTPLRTLPGRAKRILREYKKENIRQDRNSKRNKSLRNLKTCGDSYFSMRKYEIYNVL